MAKKTLVSLVSEQTIPNVELIKELGSEIDRYVFITTKQMTSQLNWIVNASNITDYEAIEVNAFETEDIEDKLNQFDFGEDEIVLNITGGTKLMSLIVNEIFKNLGAKIFYLTGQNKTYVKVFPSRGQRKFTLQKKLTLKEYLTAYGFSYRETELFKDFETSERIYKYYITKKPDELRELFEPIRLHRRKNMQLTDNNIIAFLNAVNYKYEDNRLSKDDTKYLSGEWFEEYIYYKIKTDLNLEDNEIASGLNLEKEGTKNEIDVIFVYNHKLYLIECKTSVLDYRNITRIYEGKKIDEEKEIKLLPEIIYKSDALRSKFGLFANTSIFTLEEIKTTDNKPKKGYENHFERAALSRINIVSKRDLLSGKNIKNLLKIK